MKKAVLWLTVAVLSFGISGCDSAIPIPGLGIGKEAEEETTKEETTEEETTEKKRKQEQQLTTIPNIMPILMSTI